MGRVREEQVDYDAAETSYRKAIELDPKYASPHRNLAELLDHVRNEPKEALELYRKFLALGGRDPDKSVEARIRQLTE